MLEPEKEQEVAGYHGEEELFVWCFIFVLSTGCGLGQFIQPSGMKIDDHGREPSCERLRQQPAHRARPESACLAVSKPKYLVLSLTFREMLKNEFLFN